MSTATLPPANPPCPTCGGRSVKDGHRKDRNVQMYSCRTGHRRFSANYIKPPVTCRSMAGNPHCITCHAQTHKRGKRGKAQIYYCKSCKVTIADRPDGSKRRPRRAVLIKARQEEARKMDTGLLDIINRVLPYSLPNREDVAQELALGAISGEFDLSDLPRMVPFYRRKINRLSANPFRFVSISQPIPDTNGLTIADTLAG
jgi:hypothetical protein